VKNLAPLLQVVWVSNKNQIYASRPTISVIGKLSCHPAFIDPQVGGFGFQQDCAQCVGVLKIYERCNM